MAFWSAVTVITWVAIVVTQRNRPPIVFFVIFGICVAPLAWMRWQHPLVRTRYHRFRRTLVVLALGAVWAAFPLVISMVVLAVLGGE